MTDTATKTREATKIKIKEPSKFKVIVVNDDVTPMDFVVYMFVKIFNHTEPSAVQLTMKIHNEGSAVAGIYTYEIAEQKSIEATLLARQNGHPLVTKVVEE
jgi:ATP-dependent Clp protease adaptor protein ClpS